MRRVLKLRLILLGFFASKRNTGAFTSLKSIIFLLYLHCGEEKILFNAILQHRSIIQGEMFEASYVSHGFPQTYAFIATESVLWA